MLFLCNVKSSHSIRIPWPSCWDSTTLLYLQQPDTTTNDAPFYTWLHYLYLSTLLVHCLQQWCYESFLGYGTTVTLRLFLLLVSAYFLYATRSTLCLTMLRLLNNDCPLYESWQLAEDPDVCLGHLELDLQRYPVQL